MTEGILAKADRLNSDPFRDESTCMGGSDGVTIVSVLVALVLSKGRVYLLVRRVVLFCLFFTDWARSSNLKKIGTAGAY